MQISRRVLLACVTVTAILPFVLPAEDTEAQAKGRETVEQQSKNPTNQPAVQTNAPAKPPAPAPKAPPAAPKPKTSTPAAPAAGASAAPAAAAGRQGSEWTASAPAGSKAEALEKARFALEQKMTELNAQQAGGVPPAGKEPVSKPPAGAAAAPATPSAVAETKPAKAAPADTRDAAIMAAVAEARAKQKEEAKVRKEEPPGKPIEVGAATPGVLTPLFPPPMPLSSTKERRLRELLYRYTNDQISPEQYHQQRTKILAEP
jgi:hypothetical protein